MPQENHRFIEAGTELSAHAGNRALALSVNPPVVVSSAPPKTTRWLTAKAT